MNIILKALWASGVKSKKENEEPCGKPQGINSHITNTAAATLWQATGNYQVKRIISEMERKDRMVIQDIWSK